jgi:phenol hydroxylase P1 protein
MNCTNICDRGYGTAVTAPSMFAAADHLAIAQILGRIGLAFDGNSGTALDKAKAQWMTAPEWQGMRRLVEDSLVIEDWFEQLVAQNLAIDGLLYPLVYNRFDTEGQTRGATGLSMLTEFVTDWFAEHSRWVDAVVKTAAAESADNTALISGWLARWTNTAAAALLPLAVHVLGDAPGKAAIEQGITTLKRRAQSLGLTASE